MKIRLINPILLNTMLVNVALASALSVVVLTGCDHSVNDTAIDSTTATEKSTSAADNNDANNDNSALITDIDWSKIDSGEQAAERASYNYPFDLDSQNVSDYASYFKVDNKTAQHNLTVSMASNEVLSKVLDQLSTSYTSHELTDDDNIKLIIHTTADISASNYDYVFKEDFAKGLVLPIEIKPDGVKSDVDVHSGS